MDKFLIKKAPKHAAEDTPDTAEAKKPKEDVVPGVPSLSAMGASWKTALAPEFTKPYFKTVCPLAPRSRQLTRFRS
jgi:hypothetical protein